jgi:hypothetical protein
VDQHQQGHEGQGPEGRRFRPAVERQRRAREQAERDREVLGWIARFRFVDSAVLSERFEVSRRQVNARMRRFEDAGLVVRRSDAMGHGCTITATTAAMHALGLPPRRPARTDAQVEHELAVARLVTRLELDEPGLVVLTERDMRARQSVGEGRFSVEVAGIRGGRANRWPDIVVERPDGNLALELELTGKGTTRLEQIVRAYRSAPQFAEVRFLAGSASVERRLRRLTAKESPLAALLGLPDVRLTVELHR